MTQILLKFRAVPSGLSVTVTACLQLFWELLVKKYLLVHSNFTEHRINGRHRSYVCALS